MVQKGGKMIRGSAEGMEALKTQDDDARSAITYLSDNYATKDN